MKFYLASPGGFNPMDRVGYEAFKARLREIPGVEIHCPWEGENSLTLSVHTVAGPNARAIVKCHGLIAICNGSHVDDGTAAEVGYAYGLRKPTIGLRNDFRRANDVPGAVVNAQVEYFLTNGISCTVEALCQKLEKMVSDFDQLGSCSG